MKNYKVFATSALDFFFPPRCLISHDPVDHQGMIAPRIWAKLNFIAAPLCVQCGVPFEYEIAEGTKCADCLEYPPSYDTHRSAVIYDDHSKDLILGFKHADQTHAVTVFLPWLQKAGAEMLKDSDLIVPVPLHRNRLIKRRYNQAVILGDYLARETSTEICVDALSRIKATQSQGHLKPAERAKNVRKAFIVNPDRAEILKDKKILLIDDVYTSGATVNECARILKKDGRAAKVSVLTIAKTVRQA